MEVQQFKCITRCLVRALQTVQTCREPQWGVDRHHQFYLAAPKQTHKHPHFNAPIDTHKYASKHANTLFNFSRQTKFLAQGEHGAHSHPGAQQTGTHTHTHTHTHEHTHIHTSKLNFWSEVNMLRTVIQEHSCTLFKHWKGDELKSARAPAVEKSRTKRVGLARIVYARAHTHTHT